MATPPCRLLSRMAYVAMPLALAFCGRAEADVTLRLSQPAYEVGELVSFTLSNESKYIIRFPHVTWWRITDSQGAVVDGCRVLPLEVEVCPGGSMQSSWNQLNCFDESQVPPGRYRLGAGYWSECCPGESFGVESFFDIGMVPVEPASWGHIKAVFRGR